MFRQACAIARSFTLPVVLSRITIDGRCSSGIGTFVVINAEGWIVTAAHILAQFDALIAQANQARQVESQRQAIQLDAALSNNQKKKMLGSIARLPRDHTVHCSAWWGRDGVRLAEAQSIPAVDLGVGRLEPFDPKLITTYPVFKDPTKDYEPGTSLCKLGFPFHSIIPTYDGAADAELCAEVGDGVRG